MRPSSWLFRVALTLPLVLAIACTDDEPEPTDDIVDTDTDTDSDTEPAVDADNDGFTDDVDCDDTNDAIYPGAPEEDCTDPVDYNCDGETPLYADVDEDGFAACEDCDDTLDTVNDAAEEVCDGVDNDCDELTDEADPDLVEVLTWFEDADEDGFGNADVSQISCEGPAGYVLDDTDCDDAEPESYPGNTEICDEIDNDCDTLTDDADDGVVGQGTWYADTDGDGLGDASSVFTTCFQPPLSSLDDTDCDDGDASVGGPVPWYLDNDGDGYGRAQTNACTAPPNHIAVDGDCNDSDGAINPDADEICDRKDNDCDTLIDDADGSVTGTTDWYEDDDDDDFGDENGTATSQCVAPTGYVDDNTDCDDTSRAINPDMPFDFDDDEDNDCDDSIDEDVGNETYDFSDDIQTILNSNCTGCHGSSRPSGGLNLTSNAHSRIVDVTASVTGYDYIDPGLPEYSYLFRKVEGTHTSITGYRGGKMGSLSSSDLSKIETWIEEGAVD